MFKWLKKKVKKNWYIVTLNEKGNRLDIYRLLPKKVTEDEAVDYAQSKLAKFPFLFIVFSASKMCKSGIGNVYTLQPCDKEKNILLDLSNAKNTTAPKNKTMN